MDSLASLSVSRYGGNCRSYSHLLWNCRLGEKQRD